MRPFAVLVLLASGCAPLSVTVKGDVAATAITSPGLPTYLEPFTEAAELELRTQSSGNTTLYYKDKPFFAQQETLAVLYRGAVQTLAKRPEFKPLAASRNEPVSGPVLVVRTTIAKLQFVSDSTMIQYLIAIVPIAFLCPCGLAYPFIVPVETVEVIEGVVQVFEVDAEQLQKRLVAVPGRIDPYVDTSGLQPSAQQPFRLDYRAQFGALTKREVEAVATPAVEPLTIAIRSVAGLGRSVKAPVGAPATL